MEPKPLYKTESHRLITDLLGDTCGVIMRVRLASGVGVAFAGESETGLITMSRRVEDGIISDGEVDGILGLFREVAESVDRPVLLFKYISREVIDKGNGRVRQAQGKTFLLGSLCSLFWCARADI